MAYQALSKTLGPGATITDINAALSTFDIVYLKPGTYNLSSSDQINIPAGKSLIGLGKGVPSAGTIGRVHLQWSGSLTDHAVIMREGTTLKNIHLEFLAAPGALLYAVHGAFINSSNNWTEIENVSVENWDSSNGASFSMRSGKLIQCETLSGSARALQLFNKTGSGSSNVWTIIEGCYLVMTGTDPVIEIEAGGLTGNTIIRSCRINGNGNGIEKTDGTAFINLHILYNLITGSSTAGTNGIVGFGGASDNVMIGWNTIVGFSAIAPDGLTQSLSAATGTDRAWYNNNTGRSNRADNPGGPASWEFQGNQASS